MFDAHAPVPEVELLEEQWIDVQQVEGGGVRDAHQLEIAEQHEQVVQLARLPAQLVLIAPVRGTMEHLAERRREVSPGHAPIMTPGVCVASVRRGRRPAPAAVSKHTCAPAPGHQVPGAGALFLYPREAVLRTPAVPRA